MIIAHLFATLIAHLNFYIANIAVLFYNIFMKTGKIKNEIMSASYMVSQGSKKIAHCHDEYEILYFVKGDVHYFIEGADYWLTNGGLLLIPPGILHGIKDCGNEKYERCVINIRLNSADVTTRELVRKAFNGERYYTDTAQYGINEAIEDMMSADDTGIFGAATVGVQALLMKIIMMQSKAKGAKPVISVSKTVADIIDYLNLNFTQPIMLDDISAKFFISKHHLNKMFRKGTGVTVLEYVIVKRLYHAQSMIKRGVPATQAAQLSGFCDYSSFYKAYIKRFGHSPIKDK